MPIKRTLPPKGVQGKSVETKHLERLAVPLDLHPQMVKVESDAPADRWTGGAIVVDPTNELLEILKGNNRLRLQ